MPQKHKIAVIGAGSVGASIAYACILRRLPVEITMVDVDQRTVEGQVLDLSDVRFLSPTSIKTGTNKDAGQCDIIVITAGAKQLPNEPRTKLIGRNRSILKSVIGEMQPIRKDAILLIVSNPVDLLTYIAQQLSGLPRNQVIGTGTFLDSMRLRGYLSTKLEVQENAIHCYVLGEHGDKQFIGWSSGTIGCLPIREYPGMKGINLEDVAHNVMRKAYDIIDRKGATYYGIGGCVASLCGSILDDRRDIRPVSCWDETYQCVLSIPAVIGLHGVRNTLLLSLDKDEESRMKTAVKDIKQAYDEFKNE